MLDELSDAEPNERAMNELRLKTEAAIGRFHLDACRWDVDQTMGAIRFTRDGASGPIEARAAARILGSFNTGDKTWLWSWANPSILPPLTAHAVAARELGARRNIIELTERKFACTEADCWRITALACMINGAHGAYRGPAGPTLIFMTYASLTMTRPRNGSRRDAPGGLPGADGFG